MSRRFITLLIVHHSRPRFRKLQLSYGFLACASLAIALLAAAGLLMPGTLFKLRTQSVDLERLRFENEKLWSEKGYFEGALNQIGRRIGVFEDRAGRIAEELGVRELPALDPATGGAGSADGVAERFPFESELRYLQARTEGLDRSLERIDDAFGNRMRELRSTPGGMPVDGWFSHGFGWRKDPWTGQREFHRGIDIVADEGVEIVAPADGVVSRVGRYPDYGRSIDINHGFGYVTRYAHMSDVLVKPGDRLRRGDAIGRVGSTGRSTGPHLHYEVFRDGRRVNPWAYLDHHGR